MTCRRMVSVPVERADMFDKNATHWQVLVKRGEHMLSLEYSMGSAHTGNPKIDDVMHCIMMDASIFESVDSFYNFCEELGMTIEDEASGEKAEHMYKDCRKMSRFMNKAFTESERETLDEIFQDF